MGVPQNKGTVDAYGMNEFDRAERSRQRGKDIAAYLKSDVHKEYGIGWKTRYAKESLIPLQGAVGEGQGLGAGDYKKHGANGVGVHKNSSVAYQK